MKALEIQNKLNTRLTNQRKFKNIEESIKFYAKTIKMIEELNILRLSEGLNTIDFPNITNNYNELVNLSTC